MAGYTRQDTANNIANGNVIDADDFDAEYNAIESAFNSSTGHSHDGSAGEGSPIEKVGPSQDLVVTSNNLLPKNTNTLDLGTSEVQFKDAFFDGTVDTDALTVSGNTTIGGTLGVTGLLTATSITTTSFTGDVTGNVTGTVSDISNHSTDDVSEGSSNLYYTTARSRSAISATGSLSYNSTTGVISYTQGNTDTIAEGNSNLYYTDARARNAISAVGSLSYDNASGVLSFTQGDTDSIAEGSTNLYYTNERVDDRVANLIRGGTNMTVTYDDVGGTLTFDAASGGGFDLSGNRTDDLDEGEFNLYYTTARATDDARAAISVVDNGGDGSLSYSSNTGAITYTGPSATEVRSHFTSGTGVNIASGQISIGQSVNTTSDVTFANLVVDGNLIVNGSTTTVNSNNVNIGDATLTLNSDETGVPSQDAGITIERGTSGNKSFFWDESEDEWSVFGERIKAGTFEGALSGNASTATALATSRTISLGGDVSGSASFNGTSNITITATVADDSHNHTLSNIDGITATTTEINKLDGFTGTVADLNYAKDLRATGVTTSEFDRLDGLTASTTELNYVDGVTSNIQNQIDSIPNYYVTGGFYSSGTLTLSRAGLSSVSISGFSNPPTLSTSTWLSGSSSTSALVAPVQIKAAVLEHAPSVITGSGTAQIGTLKIAWGITAVPAGGSAFQTLPFSYSSTSSFGVVAMSEDGDAPGATRAAQGVTITASNQIKLAHAQFGSNNMHWYTIGY